MEFNITSSVEGDILFVTFAGGSSEKNAQAMTKRYFEIVLASGMKKVLADLRPLKGRLSLGDTYFLVRDLPVKRVPTDIRTAILESSERREYAEFLETTSRNAGVHFKCFLDRDGALAWLRGEAVS